MWGRPSRELPTILLNGVEFPVQPNLWSFLDYARNLLPGRYLWIHAISIDQAQTKERNYQFKIMGEIYSNASRVLAWLGAEDLKLRSLFNDMRSWQMSSRIWQRPIKSSQYVPDWQKNYYFRTILPAFMSHLSWIPPRPVHLLLVPC